MTNNILNWVERLTKLCSYPDLKPTKTFYYTKILDRFSVTARQLWWDSELTCWAPWWLEPLHAMADLRLEGADALHGKVLPFTVITPRKTPSGATFPSVKGIPTEVPAGKLPCSLKGKISYYGAAMGKTANRWLTANITTQAGIRQSCPTITFVYPNQGNFRYPPASRGTCRQRCWKVLKFRYSKLMGPPHGRARCWKCDRKLLWKTKMDYGIHCRLIV